MSKQTWRLTGQKTLLGMRARDQSIRGKESEHAVLVAEKVGGNMLVDEGIEQRKLGIVRRLVGHAILTLLGHDGWGD